MPKVKKTTEPKKYRALVDLHWEPDIFVKAGEVRDDYLQASIPSLLEVGWIEPVAEEKDKGEAR